MQRKLLPNLKIQILRKARTDEDLQSADQVQAKKKKLQSKFEEHYSIVSTLGEGGSSVVCKAQNVKGENFAVKFMKSSDAEKVMAQIVEYRIMHRLNHPSIIRVYELYIDEDRHGTAMVMEHAEGRQLKDLIAKAPKGIAEEHVARIFGQVLDGIAYLHSKHISHRDLHPGNVMVSDDFSKAKIIDFNVGKYYGPTKKNKVAFVTDHRMITQTGNLFYCAPEMLNGGSYSEKVDMWSLGLVLYEMLYGTHPFRGLKNESEIISALKNDNLFDFDANTTVSVLAKNLLRTLLEIDPKKRLSAEEALHHPWVTSTKGNTMGKSASAISLQSAKWFNKCASMILPALATTKSLQQISEISPTIFFQKDLYDLPDVVYHLSPIRPDFIGDASTNCTGRLGNIFNDKMFDFNEEDSIKMIEAGPEPPKLTPRTDSAANRELVKLGIHFSTKKVYAESEIMEMMTYYKDYLEDLDTIKLDRSSSVF